MQVQPLGQEDPLEKEMAPHSSTLAWKIPWTEDLGGPQSMESQGQMQLSIHASSVVSLFLIYIYVKY